MNKDTNREIPKRDHLVNKSSTVLIIKMEKYIFFSLHTVFTILNEIILHHEAL